MKYKYLIIGSGIGGLAAAAELKEKGIEDFKIIDKVNELPLNLHNGVHYLHTNDFGTPFDFELKEIPSTEEIWNPRKDEFKKIAHIPEMMHYSMKVMGTRHPSSIMDPGNRSWKTFIPANNNMNDLISCYYDYIGKDKFEFGAKLCSVEPKSGTATFEKEGLFFTVSYQELISTAPLNLFAGICGMDLEKEFKHQSVFVTNYIAENIVPNWLVCIYISDNQFPVYRITIMNNIMSMESLVKLTPADEHITKYHLQRYFDYNLESKQDYCWETGRIWGLDKVSREEIVKMFKTKSIHLLGRFGRWDGKLTMDTTILQAKEIINSIL